MFCVILCECHNFWTNLNLLFKLELYFDHLHHTWWIRNWCPWPWPSRLNWPSVFGKKLNYFSSHLQTWTANLSTAGSKQEDGFGAGPEKHLSFVNGKKALTSLSLILSFKETWAGWLITPVLLSRYQTQWTCSSKMQWIRIPWHRY